MKHNCTKLLLPLLLCVANLSTSAHDFEMDGIYYNITSSTDLTVEVTYRGYYYSDYSNEYSDQVTIPETVVYNAKTYRVTSIGGSAFSGCRGLTSVTIPNSVTSIGDAAFSYCGALTSVNIPNSVKSIGSSAFYYCSGLKSINISNSVTSIGSIAFSGCSGLTSVIIPNSVTSIGVEAFRDCSGLTSVTIGSGVTSIGTYAFYGTTLKKTIWLTNTPPDGYTNAAGAVNYVANENFTSLKNKTVYPFLSSIFEVDGIKYVPVSPSERTCDAIDCVYDSTSVNSIVGAQVTFRGITMNVRNTMPYLCYNNKYIKNVAWKNGGDIPQYAFAECSNIQQFFTKESKEPGYLMIEPTINNIGNYAFSGCKDITTIIIPDRSTPLTLGSNGSSPLFSSLALDSVYIGGNISYPTNSNSGYSPFYRNTTLRSVVVTDKETEISPNEFYGCTNLQNVQIGDSVKTIGDYAFSGCASLKHFAFGSNVESIGKEAFSDCTNVGRIISKAATPPACGSQALDDINKWNCQLSVPVGCLPAYQAADQWKDFFFADEKAGEEGIENDPDTPGSQKCATPTIALADGQLSFLSETEGAECVWTLRGKGEINGRGSTIDAPCLYELTVYAAKEGWQDSDRTTALLVWGDGDVEGDNVIRLGGDGNCDVNGDGKIDVADIATVLSKMAGWARMQEDMEE